jgi:hypothetical protein
VAKQTEAQRKRADARENRRRSGEAPEEHDGGAAKRNEEQPLEAVKHAAKVAVAGAAVGAAAAAARALTSRGEDHEAETDSRPKAEPEGESTGEADGTSAETPPRAEREQQQPVPPKSVGESEAEQSAASEDHRRRDQPKGVDGEDAEATVQKARAQLEALLDRQVESVSAFERTHDGWLVTLEVVELSRIPESTDVLASYEMDLDDDRNVRRYARVRRYHRAQADQGDQR